MPVEEVLQTTRNRLNTDPSFLDCSPIQVEDVMELPDGCITTIYFKFEDKFCQQKRGLQWGTVCLWSSGSYSWNTLRK
jgi:hypothetical protein